MKKIIHLSDIHVGYPDMEERFGNLAREIAFLKEPANNYVIVITGDIVDSARDENFEAAKDIVEYLRGMGFEVLVVPGNHDYGTGSFGLEKNVKRFKKWFFGKMKVSYPKKDIIDGVAFLGLDSMAEELHWYDSLWANGELGEPQLKRLRLLLASSEVRACEKRVVYLHHHPFDPRFLHELKDADELGSVAKGKVDCLLYGHNHQGRIRNGKWGIPRCYDAGSSTQKMGSRGVYRVIDLTKNPREDYDGEFI